MMRDLAVLLEVYGIIFEPYASFSAAVMANPVGESNGSALSETPNSRIFCGAGDSHLGNVGLERKLSHG
jgi:hypothetical protein